MYAQLQNYNCNAVKLSNRPLFWEDCAPGKESTGTREIPPTAAIEDTTSAISDILAMAITSLDHDILGRDEPKHSSAQAASLELWFKERVASLYDARPASGPGSLDSLFKRTFAEDATVSVNGNILDLNNFKEVLSSFSSASSILIVQWRKNLKVTEESDGGTISGSYIIMQPALAGITRAQFTSKVSNSSSTSEGPDAPQWRIVSYSEKNTYEKRLPEVIRRILLGSPQPLH